MGNVGPNMLAARRGLGKNIVPLDALSDAADWGGSAAGGSTFTSVTDAAGSPYGSDAIRIQGNNAAGGTITVTPITARRVGIRRGQSIEYEIWGGIVSNVNGSLRYAAAYYDSAGVFVGNHIPIIGAATGAIYRLTSDPDLASGGAPDSIALVLPVIYIVGTGVGVVDINFAIGRIGVVR